MRVIFFVFVLLFVLVLLASHSVNSQTTRTVHEHRRRRDQRTRSGRTGRVVRRLSRTMHRRVKDGTLRLMDGTTKHEGRVEIFHLDRWGPICDDEWDLSDATVVCRQLGYTSETNVPNLKVDIKAIHNGRFGPGKSRYWLDNVFCDGTEKRFTECRHDGWGIHDCTDGESAGVICAREIPKPQPQEMTLYHHYTTTNKPVLTRKRIENIQVRLVGGRVPNEGRVLVLLHENDVWGSICGDGWSLLEAAVICRQMNLGFAQDAPQTDYFGGDPSEIITTGVKCHGTERFLGDCFHHDYEGFGTSPVCPGNGRNFASVVCTPRLPDLIPDAYEIQRSVFLEDKQLYFLQCAMEENCLASSAYRLQSENLYGWHLETRRLLRFTARIVNRGNADFRPQIPKHLWRFHTCHMHYHSMEIFAMFDILDYSGRKVAEGHKASFCLEDNECVPGSDARYACANYGDQGISVGCADIYRSNIDCQWIDVTEITPGYYTLKISINSEMKVAESDFSNNAVICSLQYTESNVYVTNCTLNYPWAYP